MSKLEHCRKKIDEIDKQLTALFEERMNVVLDVTDYKRENNLPVLNREREKEIIEKNSGYLKNAHYRVPLKKFFMGIMNISKEFEYKKMRENVESIPEVRLNGKQVKAGCYGGKGSFSEEALIRYFGDIIPDTYHYDEFEDVFRAIEKDKIEYGVLPIENSSTGAISQVYDLLTKYEFYIVGEKYIKINQHLIGHKDTNIDEVKEVYSHPQGFEQTSKFLKKYRHWKMIPFHSTADSVRLVAELKDNTKVAIASRRAAEIHDLDIIKENINNNQKNATRFIVISKQLQVAPGSNKTSVVFSLEHEPGTLYHLLRHFAENDINMMKIESRPTEEGNWKYVLYVDFEGNIKSNKVKKALSLIEEGCAYFRLLGCYVQDPNHHH